MTFQTYIIPSPVSAHTCTFTGRFSRIYNYFLIYKSSYKFRIGVTKQIGHDQD